MSAVPAAARAARMLDGVLTCTPSGCAGLAVNGSTLVTACTWSGSARRYSSVGWPPRPSSELATGNPTSAASSISGASGTGRRMPITVKYRPARYTWVSGAHPVDAEGPARRPRRAPRPGSAGWPRSGTCRATTLPPSVPSRPGWAASTEMPPVSMAGTMRCAVPSRRARSRSRSPTRPAGCARSSARRSAAAAPGDPSKPLPGGHGEQVGLRAELAEQVRLGRGGDAEHRDAGGDPDGDAERGQRRPQLARPQAEKPAADQVRRPQPRPDRTAVTGTLRRRPRSGRPASATRRSIAAATAWSCVTTTTAVPSAGQAGQQRDDLPRRPRSRGSRSARRRTPRPGWPIDGPGDGHPLALAAGQLAGTVAEPAAEPDPVERGDRGGPPPPGRHAPVEQAERHVLHRVQVVEQVELLEDEAEPAGAEPGQRGVGEPGDLLAADPDAAAGRPFQRARHVQQRGLARAGRADDRDPFAGPDA